MTWSSNWTWRPALSLVKVSSSKGAAAKEKLRARELAFQRRLLFFPCLFDSFCPHWGPGFGSTLPAWRNTTDGQCLFCMWCHILKWARRPVSRVHLFSKPAGWAITIGFSFIECQCFFNVLLWHPPSIRLPLLDIGLFAFVSQVWRWPSCSRIIISTSVCGALITNCKLHIPQNISRRVAAQQTLCIQSSATMVALWTNWSAARMVPKTKYTTKYCFSDLEGQSHWKCPSCAPCKNCSRVDQIGFTSFRMRQQYMMLPRKIWFTKGCRGFKSVGKELQEARILVSKQPG